MFPESSSVVYSKPKQLRDCITTKYFVIREWGFCIINIIITVFGNHYFFKVELSQYYYGQFIVTYRKYPNLERTLI